jgi:uncharacterized membrane protein YdcZ (DUF606 family)
LKKFLHTLQPIEKVAFFGVLLGALILVGMGFVYPQVGVTVLFMLGVLSLFWSVLTLIAAVTRYHTSNKRKRNNNINE